ncbi:Cryptochrome DASH like [Actinidia chinensis var. chinensis]|uniref:Cryptochrome DASH like n=1 Tax=Actinidia chinensis var. chinensis TaxID=1590841 RepID=A0A2R6RT37_ACTCC|nr:Cryptochrome DASH like [Actinidia chinensis var. chinensis]
MALLVFPRFLPLTSLSPNLSSRPQTRLLCSSLAMASMSSTRTRTESSVGETAGAAVLWFKHDLRLDDHPGLVAASRFRKVVPLYVFDRRILSRFSDEMLEVLLFALEDLRKSLKDQGSGLLIRFGTAENVIQELVKEVKATSIFVEEEVEYELCRLMDLVREAIAKMSFPKGNPRFVLWNTPLYDIKNLKDLPESYHEFKKLKFSAISPILPPKLPNFEMDLTWGSIPTLDDLKKFMNDCQAKSKDSWTSIREISAETVLHKNQFVPSSNQVEGLRLAKSGEIKQNNSYEHSQRSKTQESVFVTQSRNIVGGGTTGVLNALAAYLRNLEGTVRDDWKEVHEKLRNAESREGASFGTLFGSALGLGIISRRRAHYEATKYEKERNAGFLSPFGYSAATIAAVADTICSMEWYWVMASKSQFVDKGIYDIRIWRWKGFLIQYAVVGDEGPAILLVHGFGAFLEHYRDNISGIAEGGNRVWAITLLGFGKSEKPNVVYTEVMWAELLKDFIIEVVGEPVHLVGNSMGGYFVAIVAGLWPAAAKSVVLINTAGNVIPQYSSVPFSEERQTSVAAWLGARLLLLYARLRVKNIMKNLYPSRVERADDWIINQMIRASYDPGVVVVLESIFTFNLSIPLNYLLEGFENRVLVIQGMKDPLPNSRPILAMLREHCKGLTVRELDAGHCPHDELPEEVNSIIQEWVFTERGKILSGDRI